MEYERIIKEALLTDGKIIELLRLEYGEEPKFTMNLKLLDVEDNMVYLPDALAYIAQAQLDKVLKTDGIEIRAENQDLPLSGPYTLTEATAVRQARQDMLKAGFVKVIPKNGDYRKVIY